MRNSECGMRNYLKHEQLTISETTSDFEHKEPVRHNLSVCS